MLNLDVKPLLQHAGIQSRTGSHLSGLSSQTAKAAIVTMKNQEMAVRVQHEPLAAYARKRFESGYRTPADCENWESHQKMLDYGNDRVRAKRLFLAQHPEFATLSEIDLQ